MIASLPMYWRAETADHWRAFWKEVQTGLDLPDLTDPADLPEKWTDHWLDPNLVLSMTCSLPFRSSLRDKVTYVGTLSFGLPLEVGYYNSCRIGARETRLANKRLAINGFDSQSGWCVAWQESKKFSEVIVTGSHAASLAAVAEGRADEAYIDAVTWRLLKRYDPLAKKVYELGETPASPGLPLITAKDRDPQPLRDALKSACERFAPNEPLAMGGPLNFVVLDEATYLDLPIPPTGHF